MARCQLQPQLDERSPQPSTLGYSLLEVIDDEVPGPSVPWVDPSTPSKFLCWNRKREWSDQSEEEPKEETEKELAPEPEETWVLDTLCGLKMKLKRRRVSPMLCGHPEAFNRLLGGRQHLLRAVLCSRLLPNLENTEHTLLGPSRVWKKALDRTGTRFCGREQSLGEIMASCQPQPQVEERSPQPSTLGYCLLEVVDDEVPGPADPGTPNILCCKRKREWSDESEKEPEEETEKERAPEPEETWVLGTLCGLKMKLKRRQVSPTLPKNYEAFNTLLVGNAPQWKCYTVACFLYSSPWEGPSSPWFLCHKRKREWSDESEEEPEEETEERTPEPEETWVLETLQGLKMKLKRRRVSPVLPEHHQAFNRLLGKRTPQRAPPILFF
ncbi:speedy protein E3-like [Sapajus apella]|uniref:Speedy protein E3-like n=1 Tax=Sapajus apella TaxID=9515 RepID=A0A6J3HED0_SAPAP|nr:speedy protein E3-like [Sapajus apella]